MAPITFRNSKISYYGPHDCDNCGQLIVKMGREWGGTAFNNPIGPIYPNTEWHPHVCHPDFVKQRLSMVAANRVSADLPNAHAVMVGKLGYVILGEAIPAGVQGGTYLVVSANQTFCDTMESAWASALERIENGWPSWHIDFSKYGPDAAFSDDLQRLPECPA